MTAEHSLDAHSLESLSRELEAWSLKRKQCAGRFGRAKRDGADTTALKAEMAQITANIKRIESSIRMKQESKEDTKRLVPMEEPAAVAEIEHPAPAVRLPVDVEIAVSAIDHVPDWQEFVSTHDRATLYHDARWLSIIRDVFGHEHFALTLRSKGAIVGVLPLVRQKSWLFGDFLTSLPFVNYGGALAQSRALEQQLMQGAASLADRIGCRHVEFRDVASREGWPQRATKASMRLALPSSAEQLWRDVGSKVRSQVRRPEREGARSRIGGIEMVDAFYGVFSRNMRDLGTPVYPIEWFAEICKRFAEDTRFVTVDMDGRCVAAGMLLRHRQSVEIPWASTIREYNQYGVNMMLYWRCLSWAMEVGAEWFDFGRSSIGASTQRFKAQWGATATPLHWHYHLKGKRALPELNPSAQRFSLPIAIWKRLPLVVTRTIGPHIVKHLP